MTVKIKVEDGKVKVESPYNGGFVARARDMGGKWASPCWVFDERDERMVRQACLDVYGTDGTPTAVTTIRVSLDEALGGWGADELAVGPVQVLKKWNRDQRPRLGPGCVVVEGALKSHGGSRRNPKITFEEGTIIEVRDVPVLAARQAVEEDHDAFWMVSAPADDLTAEEKSIVEMLRALEPERLEKILEELKS